MKRISFVLITVMLSTFAFAQIENTKWKSTLQIDGPVNVIFDFKKDTVSLYTVADSSLIETMTYTNTDTSFTLMKIDGQSDCDNSTPGRYRFVITGDSLHLQLLNDDCDDRSSVIENTGWKKWKDYPGIKIDESILKQYAGVYELDDAHPINITFEDGILYAEGPNNGLPKSPFTAITETKFFLRVAAVEMDFVKDANGNVIKLISHEEKDYELKKVK